MINIILLFNGSNIVAEEIAREKYVKKREGKKKNKTKKHRLIFEIEAQTILWCSSSKHRIRHEMK